MIDAGSPLEGCYVFIVDGLQVNEMITENPDGSYTVLINSNLCQSKREGAIAHALGHITGRDFEKSDVQEIEINAHLTH